MKSTKKQKNEKFEFNEDRYIRLILVVFFSMLTLIVLFLGIVFFRSSISPVTNLWGYYIFCTILAFLQTPFISFITEDFVPKRLKTIRTILFWITRIVIFLMILVAIIIAYSLLGWKTATGGLLLAAIPIVLQNWKKIDEVFSRVFKRKKKT